MLDLAIRNGIIVDGTGSARRPGDIGIRDGRIVAIGTVEDKGHREVNADGLIVAPGFIDLHTHLDVQAFWDPNLSPSGLHGVTSIVAGNCGFGIAPMDKDSAEYIRPMLAKVEGMPVRALELGAPWDWGTTEEYLGRLDGRMSLNAGFMVGHSTLRRVVMRDEASERLAEPAELEAMCGLLRESLRAGGMGFSSSWGISDLDGDGRPVPSRVANSDELIALSQVCGEFPGTSLAFIPSKTGPFADQAHLMGSMSAAAQRPLNWNVLQVSAAKSQEAHDKLRASDIAREQGGRVLALTMPFRLAARMSFMSSHPLDALPGWAEPMACPLDDKIKLLSDPEQRRRLAELASRPNPYSVFAQWPTHVVNETFTDATKKYEGRKVGEIASEEDKLPFDALLDIVCADGLRTRFSEIYIPESDEDWQLRLKVWRSGSAVIGASDAGAHLDTACNANYFTRLLDEAVRKRELLPLEEMVHMLSDVPAQLYGLHDRGRLEEGCWADIVIFDEETVASKEVVSRHDLPDGSDRLYAESEGIVSVIVSGTEVVSDGQYTESRPGRALHSGRDSRTPSMR